MFSTVAASRLRLGAPDVKRLVGLRLHDLDELFPQELQDRDEGDGDAEAPFFRPEQADELHQPDALQVRKHVRHALAHRQRLALHVQAARTSWRAARRP